MDLPPTPVVVDAYEEFWQHAEGDAPPGDAPAGDGVGAYDLYWDGADGE